MQLADSQRPICPEVQLAGSMHSWGNTGIRLRSREPASRIMRPARIRPMPPDGKLPAGSYAHGWPAPRRR
jgi:hypothetical protein